MLAPYAVAHWRRVALAATRLALIYAFGVAVTLGVVLTVVDGPRELLSALGELLLPGLGLFALAFVLLAVARRAGFVALWLLLVGFWMWITIGNSHLIVEGGFLAWTALAIPLFLLAALGTMRPVAIPIGRRRVSLTPIVVVAWVTLALLALAYEHGALHVLARQGWRGVVLAGVRQVWLAAPYFLAAFAILHAWLGLAAGNAEQRVHN